ncbi:fimbrial protein [Yersinia aleksiciae]|uniref:Oxidoreductase n=1 Tax=Yersinia aleksiciae TaxID=263819 RepID=A0ABM5UCJ1_YERAE|nr:fimbrial protein [Yersinia aleksiciae]AKP33550.1 oxidoreductase [Yersinia aleksiciae]CFQ40657.1 fimbrial protein [Yersinia aleksiciae]
MSIISRMPLLTILALSFLPPPVLAYDVLVSVTGKLIGNTCTVSTDSKMQTVPLGNIATKQFGVSHGVSNIKTPFFINLEECGPTFTGVKIRFVGTPDGDAADLIKVDDGSATGVAVELLNKDEQPLALNRQTDVLGTPGAENVQMKFHARLAATGSPVSPGPVSAIATWVLEYQ